MCLPGSAWTRQTKGVRLLGLGLKNRPRKFPLEIFQAIPRRAKIREVADDCGFGSPSVCSGCHSNSRPSSGGPYTGR